MIPNDDPVTVAHDDALLDLAGSARPELATLAGTDRWLVLALLAWRQDVDSEPYRYPECA